MVMYGYVITYENILMKNVIDKPKDELEMDEKRSKMDHSILGEKLFHKRLRCKTDVMFNHR